MDNSSGHISHHNVLTHAHLEMPIYNFYIGTFPSKVFSFPLKYYVSWNDSISYRRLFFNKSKLDLKEQLCTILASVPAKRTKLAAGTPEIGTT